MNHTEIAHTHRVSETSIGKKLNKTDEHLPCAEPHLPKHNVAEDSFVRRACAESADGEIASAKGKPGWLRWDFDCPTTSGINGCSYCDCWAKGEGELCYDEALEFTGVLAKLVAQGLRLKFTERNTFSKDEVLGDRGR